MVFQIKIHLEEGVAIKNKLKILLISIIFCIVTLSFYKIIVNEIFTSDSIFLKAAKSILVILASLIVTVILYGLYLERMFERKYRGSVKVYLDKSRWREATIIILYSFVILYSFGMVFNIWTFILLPYISMLVFGLKNNGIIVEYDCNLYFISRDYVLDMVKEISYDPNRDILRVVIINDQDKTEKIKIDRVKDKKIFEELILLIKRYKL